MQQRSRQLAVVLLALLAPALDAACARDNLLPDAPPDVAPDPAAPRTHGEVLIELAGRAALRAARAGAADDGMEAISDLAVRWLEARDDDRTVWQTYPRSEQSVALAVRNSRRDLYRTQRRHERLADALASRPGTGATTAANQFAAARLEQVLRDLDDDDRVLLLHKAAGLDSRELGELLGVTPAAARQRLVRARQKLAV